MRAQTLKYENESSNQFDFPMPHSHQILPLISFCFSTPTMLFPEGAQRGTKVKIITFFSAMNENGHFHLFSGLRMVFANKLSSFLLLSAAVVTTEVCFLFSKRNRKRFLPSLFRQKYVYLFRFASMVGEDSLTKNEKSLLD